MKVVFMGTPDFAEVTLQAIADAGHEIVLVVTQPDKPKGRGKEMQFSPVKKWALDRDIPVFQPVRIR
jgi:methionyl-tRNA formyltransferase